MFHARSTISYYGIDENEVTTIMMHPALHRPDIHRTLITPLTSVWIATAGSLALCLKILLSSLLPLWTCWLLLLTQDWWIIGLLRLTRSLPHPLIRYSLIGSPLLAGLVLSSYWSYYGIDLLHFLQAVCTRLGITS